LEIALICANLERVSFWCYLSRTITSMAPTKKPWL
jgi:hypothetical protein